MPVTKRTATKVLPTWRMAALKQLEVLRAYGASCENEPRTVTNAEISAIVGLKPETVSLANSFFASIDLIVKNDSENGHIPSEDLLNYAKAYQWNQETAFHKIAPKLGRSWIGETILPKVRFGPLTVEQAISAIGEAANVGPDAKQQIEMVIWFLEQAGIVVRENGTINLAKPTGPQSQRADDKSEQKNKGAPSNPPQDDKDDDRDDKKDFIVFPLHFGDSPTGKIVVPKVMNEDDLVIFDAMVGAVKAYVARKKAKPQS